MYSGVWGQNVLGLWETCVFGNSKEASGWAGVSQERRREVVNP